MSPQNELTAAVQKAQRETDRRRFLRRVLGLGGIAGLSALMGWEGHRAYGAPSGNPRETGEDYISFVNTLLKEEDVSTLAIRDLADSAYRDLKLREILAGTWKGTAIGDTYLSAAAQAAIAASHAAVSVAGAPLTLSTQQITFNKSSTHFDLSGNDLILKAAGHGTSHHDTTISKKRVTLFPIATDSWRTGTETAYTQSYTQILIDFSLFDKIAAIYFGVDEVQINSGTYAIYAQLYDQTAGAAVTGSELTTSCAQWAHNNKESADIKGNLVLTAGNRIYDVQKKTAASGQYALVHAWIKVVQSE